MKSEAAFPETVVTVRMLPFFSRRKGEQTYGYRNDERYLQNRDSAS